MGTTPLLHFAIIYIDLSPLLCQVSGGGTFSAVCWNLFREEERKTSPNIFQIVLETTLNSHNIGLVYKSTVTLQFSGALGVYLHRMKEEQA
jgi:hypothetical protein